MQQPVSSLMTPFSNYYILKADISIKEPSKMMKQTDNLFVTNKFRLYLKETDANEDCNTKGILCTIIYEQCDKVHNLM